MVAKRVATVEPKSFDADPGGYEIEIKARMVAESDGFVTLSLEGVRPISVDWGYVRPVLLEAGISIADATALLDKFAEETDLYLLARILAEHIRRV